jgi:dihydroneopterin aldolase
MFTIYLEHLIFSSYHGVHDEERLCAGQFEVNLELTVDDVGKPITTLNQTIDYAAVFECVEKNMNIPTPLLETLIQQMEQDLLVMYPNIYSLSVKINKKNPPIKGMQGNVAVGYKKNYMNQNS